MDGINWWGFWPFGVLLLVAYLYRLWRQHKGRKLLNKNPNAAKMYVGNGKTIDDGIKVYLLNGKKPVLGRDKIANYVVLNAGENTLSVAFVALKDFAKAVAVKSVSHVYSAPEEQQAEIVCVAQAKVVYQLSFNKQTGEFEFSPYMES